ncbi:MAG: MFS transporter [Candidatus Thermoplasmatota archaeon]
MGENRNLFAAPAQGGAVAAQDDVKTSVGQFAVVNVSELLERLAYYGVLSVFGLYLRSLDYSAALIGLLTGILLPLPYLMSLLAGPLGEKFGFKTVMATAFVCYASGFTLIGLVPEPTALVAGIVLVGVGAGLFKPLTAAAIAYVTAPERRTFGYSVYYTGINIGGFLGPVLIATLGTDYRAAFLLGAAVLAADLVMVLLLFRNPVARRADASLASAFRPLATVFQNGRFIGLLAIFSGFWFLYSMNFSFLTPYVASFVPLPDWFPASLQQSISPLLIIFLGIPLGGFASRRDPVRMMTIGIALFVCGFILIGFVRTLPALLIGIALSAVGEVLAYPGFLSYVSRIAPPGQVAIYQGYGFLPIFLGFFVGPIVGGALYGNLVDGMARPSLFWSILCSIGILTVAAFLLYARILTPKPERRRAGAAGAVVALLLVPLLVVGGVVAGTVGGIVVESPPPGTINLGSWEGIAVEGRVLTQPLRLNATAGNVTATLRWTDGTPPGTLPGAANGPDRFRVTLRDTLGVLASREGSSDGTGRGELTLTAATRTGGGEPSVEFTLLDAGDATLGPATVATDTEAQWSLEARLDPASS